MDGYNATPVKLFPIKSDDLELFRREMKRLKKPTAAGRSHDAAKGLQRLGFPVEVDATKAGPARLPRRPRPEAAREPQAPLGVVLLEMYACSQFAPADALVRSAGGRKLRLATEGKAYLEPSEQVVDFARGIHTTLRFGLRGVDGVGSCLNQHDDMDSRRGELKLITGITKDWRTGVVQAAPMEEGFVYPNLGWVEQHVTKYSMVPFFFADFQARDRVSSCDIMQAVAWTKPREGTAEFKYCYSDRAKRAQQRIMMHITRQTLKQLQDRLVSGTHWERKVGATIVSLLDWPKRQRELLGDWADSEKHGARAAPGKPRSAAVSRSTVEVYSPRNDRRQQFEVRRRYFAAVRKAIEVYGGVSALTWDTTWEQLFPDKSLLQDEKYAELRQFYGDIDVGTSEKERLFPAE